MIIPHIISTTSDLYFQINVAKYIRNEMLLDTIYHQYKYISFEEALEKGLQEAIKYINENKLKTSKND